MTELLELMNQSVDTPIPSGLVDDGIEFFVKNKDLYAIYDGMVWKFKDWDEKALSYVESDMAVHPEAVECLVELGLEERLAMIGQYARCRFGGFDNYCDVKVNGEVIHTEYWDCGFRGKCPYEGRLCSTIQVKNGILSPREIDVIKLIYEGQQSKEIAATLNISALTVNVHIQHIFQKTGLRSSIEVSRFAAEKKIYSIKHIGE